MATAKPKTTDAATQPTDAVQDVKQDVANVESTVETQVSDAATDVATTVDADVAKLSGVADVALTTVSPAISDAVAQAAKAAQAEGDNATHAALHSVHVALGEFTNRINDALKSVEGEAAELLQGIKNLF